ncbi:hypothetical protein BC831DRAFT_514615 [Entophlyctis helioformis]|nr:hypothetical protein BC831DRAFT_514615 [Entophlyctis helioformis]
MTDLARLKAKHGQPVASMRQIQRQGSRSHPCSSSSSPSASPPPAATLSDVSGISASAGYDAGHDLDGGLTSTDTGSGWSSENDIDASDVAMASDDDNSNDRGVQVRHASWPADSLRYLRRRSRRLHAIARSAISPGDDASQHDAACSDSEAGMAADRTSFSTADSLSSINSIVDMEHVLARIARQTGVMQDETRGDFTDSSSDICDGSAHQDAVGDNTQSSTAESASLSVSSLPMSRCSSNDGLPADEPPTAVLDGSMVSPISTGSAMPLFGSDTELVITAQPGNNHSSQPSAINSSDRADALLSNASSTALQDQSAPFSSLFSVFGNAASAKTSIPNSHSTTTLLSHAANAANGGRRQANGATGIGRHRGSSMAITASMPINPPPKQTTESFWGANLTLGLSATLSAIATGNSISTLNGLPKPESLADKRTKNASAEDLGVLTSDWTDDFVRIKDALVANAAAFKVIGIWSVMLISYASIPEPWRFRTEWAAYVCVSVANLMAMARHSFLSFMSGTAIIAALSTVAAHYFSAFPFNQDIGIFFTNMFVYGHLVSRNKLSHESLIVVVWIMLMVFDFSLKPTVFLSDNELWLASYCMSHGIYSLLKETMLVMADVRAERASLINKADGDIVPLHGPRYSIHEDAALNGVQNPTGPETNAKAHASTGSTMAVSAFDGGVGVHASDNGRVPWTSPELVTVIGTRIASMAPRANKVELDTMYYYSNHASLKDRFDLTVLRVTSHSVSIVWRLPHSLIVSLDAAILGPALSPSKPSDAGNAGSGVANETPVIDKPSPVCWPSWMLFWPFVSEAEQKRIQITKDIQAMARQQSPPCFVIASTHALASPSAAPQFISTPSTSTANAFLTSIANNNSSTGGSSTPASQSRASASPSAFKHQKKRQPRRPHTPSTPTTPVSRASNTTHRIDSSASHQQQQQQQDQLKRRILTPPADFGHPDTLQLPSVPPKLHGATISVSDISLTVNGVPWRKATVALQAGHLTVQGLAANQKYELCVAIRGFGSVPLWISTLDASAGAGLDEQDEIAQEMSHQSLPLLANKTGALLGTPLDAFRMGSGVAAESGTIASSGPALVSESAAAAESESSVEPANDGDAVTLLVSSGVAMPMAAEPVSGKVASNAAAPSLSTSDRVGEATGHVAISSNNIAETANTSQGNTVDDVDEDETTRSLSIADLLDSIESQKASKKTNQAALKKLKRDTTRLFSVLKAEAQCIADSLERDAANETRARLRIAFMAEQVKQTDAYTREVHGQLDALRAVFRTAKQETDDARQRAATLRDTHRRLEKTANKAAAVFDKSIKDLNDTVDRLKNQLVSVQAAVDKLKDDQAALQARTDGAVFEERRRCAIKQRDDAEQMLRSLEQEFENSIVQHQTETDGLRAACTELRAQNDALAAAVREERMFKDQLVHELDRVLGRPPMWE